MKTLGMPAVLYVKIWSSPRGAKVRSGAEPQRSRESEEGIWRPKRTTEAGKFGQHVWVALSTVCHSLLVSTHPLLFFLDRFSNVLPKTSGDSQSTILGCNRRGNGAPGSGASGELCPVKRKNSAVTGHNKTCMRKSARAREHIYGALLKHLWSFFFPSRRLDCGDRGDFRSPDVI